MVSVHRVPFDDLPYPLVDELRAQISRLHEERKELRTAIDLLHRATANLQAENDRLRHQLAHQQRRNIPERWWHR